MVDDSEYSYWESLVSLFDNVDNAPLKKGQGVFQVWWVCNVEDEVHTEGGYEGFIKTIALAHIYTIYFHHTGSSTGHHHFPVVVHQLNGWIGCSSIPL